MKAFAKFVLLATLSCVGAAMAQDVNYYGLPGTTVIMDSLKKTYSACQTLVAPAATPTDLAILNGSATKLIKVKSVTVSALATGAGYMDASLVMRSTANTGGTCPAVAAIPLDAADAAATAVLSACTANPTLGTAVGGGNGEVADLMMLFGTAAVTGSPPQFMMPPAAETVIKPVVLRGVLQGLAINLNGQALPAGGKVSYCFTWTEE